MASDSRGVSPQPFSRSRRPGCLGPRRALRVLRVEQFCEDCRAEMGHARGAGILDFALRASLGMTGCGARRLERALERVAMTGARSLRRRSGPQWPTADA